MIPPGWRENLIKVVLNLYVEEALRNKLRVNNCIGLWGLAEGFGVSQGQGFRAFATAVEAI